MVLILVNMDRRDQDLYTGTKYNINKGPLENLWGCNNPPAQGFRDLHPRKGFASRPYLFETSRQASQTLNLTEIFYMLPGSKKFFYALSSQCV